VEVLRPGGRLAFITSGSWVRANFGAPLRRFLSANAKMESMVDFGEFQPFEDVEMIRPSITVLSKGTPGGEMRLFKWLIAGRPPEALSEVIAAAPTISTSRLADTWELEPDSVLNLRDKLSSNGTVLRDYCRGMVYRGVLTGLTEAYVVDWSTRDKLIAVDPTCQQFIRPFVQGTHLRTWYIEEDQQYLIALKSSANFHWPWSENQNHAEQLFRETHPSVFEHLNQFRDAAIKRTDQGEFWWSYAVARIGKPSSSPRLSGQTSASCPGSAWTRRSAASVTPAISSLAEITISSAS
jgi:hypothetical protein